MARTHPAVAWNLPARIALMLVAGTAAALSTVAAGCGGGEEPPKKESSGRQFAAYDNTKPGTTDPEPEPETKIDEKGAPEKSKTDDDPITAIPALKKREPPKKAEPPPPPVKKVSLLVDHEWKSRESITGHTDRIEWAAYAPDGKALVTASRDKTLKLWSAADAKEIGAFKGHTDRVLCCAFSPDGTVLISGGDDRSVRIWSPASPGKGAFSLFAHGESVKSVAFAPDGKSFASGSADKTVRLWDAEKRKEAAVLRGHTMPVESVAFARDGTPVSAATDGKTGEIIVWNAEEAKPAAVWKVPEGRVPQIAISPDGATLAAACGDRSVKLFDFPSGKLRASLRVHRDAVLSVTFCFDSLLLASGSEDLSIILWDLSENKPLTIFRDQPGFVYFVLFSPNGETAAGASSGGLRFWGAGLGKPPPPPSAKDKPTSDDTKNIKVLEIKEDVEIDPKCATRANFESYTSVAVSPDGATALLGGGDYTVGLWSPAAAPVPVTLSGHDTVPSTIALSPDGKTVASVGSSAENNYIGELKLWDLAKRRPLYTDKRVNETYAGAAFARDNKTVAVGVNGFDGARRVGAVRLYQSAVKENVDEKNPKAPKQVVVWRELRTLPRAAGHITALAWSPDASHIASVTKNGIQVWSPAEGKAVAAKLEPEGYRSVVYAPDGSAVLVGGGDGIVRVLGPSDLTVLKQWQAHAGPVTGLAAASDSKTLATAGDNTAKIWDLKSGKARLVFSNHKERVTGLALSRDGRIAVTIAQDRTAKMWTTDDTILPFRKEAKTP